MLSQQKLVSMFNKYFSDETELGRVQGPHQKLSLFRCDTLTLSVCVSVSVSECSSACNTVAPRPPPQFVGDEWFSGGIGFQRILWSNAQVCLMMRKKIVGTMASIQWSARTVGVAGCPAMDQTLLGVSDQVRFMKADCLQRSMFATRFHAYVPKTRPAINTK